MGDYAGWIEFDFEPTPGTNDYPLTYSGDNNTNAIGYQNGPHTVEVAAKYPLSFYCGKVGTYINKVSYFMYQNSVDSKLTARVYGGGTYNKPGVILAEKTINNPNIEAWNDFTLDTPILLDGQDIWVAFEFQQPVGGFLMSTSDSEAVENSTWERLNGGSWSQLLTVGNPPQPIDGSWMIKAFTQGTVEPGCWMSLAGDAYGNLPKGTSKTFNATFNATGLAEGTYKANIKVKTNDPDPERELFTIPCIITVVNSSAMSVNPPEIDEIVTKYETITVKVTITNSGNISGTYEVKDATVEWLTLTGSTAGTLQPNASGIFDVVLDAEELANGDYETSIEISVTDLANDKIIIPCILRVDRVGIDEHTIKTLVFPNPATNEVTVKSTQNINTIQIINFVGQTVYSTNVNKDQITINTSNLSAGIYFIRVNTEVGSQNIKLIIK